MLVYIFTYLQLDLQKYAYVLYFTSNIYDINFNDNNEMKFLTMITI